MMLHTKYQSSRPCGFREGDFESFHLENLFLASVTWICNGLEPFGQFFNRAI